MHVGTGVDNFGMVQYALLFANCTTRSPLPLTEFPEDRTTQLELYILPPLHFLSVAANVARER